MTQKYYKYRRHIFLELLLWVALVNLGNFFRVPSLKKKSPNKGKQKLSSCKRLGSSSAIQRKRIKIPLTLNYTVHEVKPSSCYRVVTVEHHHQEIIFHLH